MSYSLPEVFLELLRDPNTTITETVYEENVSIAEALIAVVREEFSE